MFRRLLNWVVYMAALAIFAEVSLAGLHYATTGSLIYARDPDAGTVPPALQLPGAVFQPYFGYTLREGRDGDYLEQGRWVANNFGFHNMAETGIEGCCDYRYRPRPNDYVVGVFGGSVGSGFALQAQADGSLARALKAVDRLQDRTIVVLNFALPGFHQPQQLTALAYFLSIGQHFDLVLNIDGFNEVVTSWKNWSDGVEPSYPADTLWGAWGRQLEQQNVPVGERWFHLANYHQHALSAAHEDRAACTIAVCYYWAEVRMAFHGWRAAVNRAALPETSEQRSIFPTKTVSRLGEGFNVFDDTAGIWLRSSVAMARLAESAGAEYLHILQPNQWFREAGAYTPIAADHVYEWVIDPINEGYPRLRAAAGELEAAGVHFLDGSLLFKGQAERDVYFDDCCHYSARGYHLIFEAAARLLAESGRAAAAASSDHGTVRDVRR